MAKKQLKKQKKSKWTPLALLTGSTLLLGAGAFTLLPNGNDPKKASVFITNYQGNSGGSGAVISIKDGKSTVLTNKHVCEVVKNGGYVRDSEGSNHVVETIRMSKDHDLCLVTVNKELPSKLDLSKKAADNFEKVTTVGHPRLLPTTITQGHAGPVIDISVVTGSKECPSSPEGLSDDEIFSCMFFGKLPIISKLPAQYTTTMIQPGSSGSPTVNESGDIIGVIFAGSGDIGFGFMVPYTFVKNFLQGSDNSEEIKVSKEVTLNGMAIKTKEESLISKIKRGCIVGKLKPTSKLCRVAQDGFIIGE